jgi:hypothetical protein
LAKGHIHRSLGQSRFAATPQVLQKGHWIGQRPYSRLNRSVEYGRWPIEQFNEMEAPGALPLDMLNMAFGQHAVMLLTRIGV